jgi:hypothetical protein
LQRTSKERRLFLHFLLLFFIHRKHVSRRLDSEGDLDNVLATLHASRSSLEIQKIENIEDKNMLYKEKRTNFKPISRVAISKYEHEQYSSANPHIQKTCRYFYSLPGFSMLDFLLSSDRALEYIDFTEKEVEEALGTLLNEDLIYQTLQFDSEAIFMINITLLNLLKPCANIYDKAYLRLVESWKLRRPKDHEIKWLQVFIGHQETERVRSEAYRSRHSIGRDKKHRIAKDIEDLDREIRKLIDNVHSIIDTNPENKKYKFPVFKLVDLFYPTNLR